MRAPWLHEEGFLKRKVAFELAVLDIGPPWQLF
jgi:hypothetical protein